MDLFDPDRFRREGHALIDQLADYLARAERRELPVLPWAQPAARLAEWPADFPAAPNGDLAALMTRVLAQSNHLHHPRYVGHQVTAPLPMAALCELVAALLNNGMAVYEMGPVSTVMERSVVRWLCGRLGWDSLSEPPRPSTSPDGAMKAEPPRPSTSPDGAMKADGVLTSGGSAGNLTGLLAARQARAGFDVWTEGLHGGPPLAVLASEQTHYCVRRALSVMGLGAGSVYTVPVDARFRLRADALAGAHAAAERAGRRVFAVVASAGSTATGAFDPLDEIADYCQPRGLWLHVDGAHGGSAAVSDKYRSLLAGVERADSVVWDMHKMMLMPALVTAVLFRDGRHSYGAFMQEASYLFSGDGEEAWIDGAKRTLECTKRMMALKVYAGLSLCGTQMFADYLDATFDLARRFAAQLTAAPDFELAVEPQGNIVCFRHLVKKTEDLDALQSRIRQRLVADGSFYLVQTTLPTGVHLRTTLINPLTTDADLAALLDAVRAAATAR